MSSVWLSNRLLCFVLRVRQSNPSLLEEAASIVARLDIGLVSVPLKERQTRQALQLKPPRRVLEVLKETRGHSVIGAANTGTSQCDALTGKAMMREGEGDLREVSK